MKNLFYPLAAALILLTSATFLTTPIKYVVQEGFKIEFKSKDPSGVFKDLEGHIEFDKGDLDNSKVDFKIKVSSINTGNGMQNKKAQTAEWFNASKYPDITFKSNKITEANGTYYVYGNLKIKGTSKTYKVPMNVSEKEKGMTLTGSFTVKRSDFKVGKPGGTVPDGMKITYSIPVTK